MTLDRRKLIAGTAASTAALLSAKQLSGTELKTPASNYMLCAFVKFIQKLPYQQLAETVADLGFDGIEATVREGGQVLPERVQDDLPKLVEALRKHNLEIGVMASSVHQLDQPDTEKVLRTASQLGIKRYRMKYFRYDLNRPVIQQINQIRAQLERLVPVFNVVDLTVEGPSIERELALIKVVAQGENRIEALRVADIFRARAVDSTLGSFVFEVTGESSKINAFIDLMRPLGLAEVSRTGVVAIARGAEAM